MTAMTRLRLGAALAISILMATLAEPAAAQGGGRFDVTLGTATIAFPTPGILEFDAGQIDHSGMIVTVQARPPQTAWELRIRADAVSLGGYGKPIEDILWRTATSTAWTPLSTTDEAVLQGQGDADVTIYFRLRLDWAVDLPGSYDAGITFSLVRL